MYRSETISISIDSPLDAVYEFLLEPLNLPTWVAATGGAIHHLRDRDWVVEIEGKRVVFRYAERNPYGVLDYTTMRDGEDSTVTPMRVFANGRGTELTLTLFLRPKVTEDVFRSEIEWVRADLLALKSLLESRRRR